MPGPTSFKQHLDKHPSLLRASFLPFFHPPYPALVSHPSSLPFKWQRRVLDEMRGDDARSPSPPLTFALPRGTQAVGGPQPVNGLAGQVRLHTSGHED